jgi:hypothetical protein
MYAHDADGVRWIGCIDGVFTAEVDLRRLQEQEAAHPGFGALRAEGAPGARCKAAVDMTFPHRDDGQCTEKAFRTAHPRAADGREPVTTRRALPGS